MRGRAFPVGLALERDAVRERTVEIEFLEPGAAAYVFTFG